MKVLKDLFASKKFIVALAGMLIQAIAFFNPDLADMADQIIKVVIGYVIGQGVADFGKEAKKIDDK